MMLFLSPFDSSPIDNCHYSPFMTREKTGSVNRRTIIDLSWPMESSVNAGIDKNSYLNADFALTFPTVDHTTHEFKRLSGVPIFSKLTSAADYDPLGLYWNGHYLDMCLPFGSCHGMQIFQRVSDAVRYVVCTCGYKIINYVDDFCGMGTPCHAHDTYDCLYSVLNALGLSFSAKKLVCPGMQAVCLGTVSIPEEKWSRLSSWWLLGKPKHIAQNVSSSHYWDISCMYIHV